MLDAEPDHPVEEGRKRRTIGAWIVLGLGTGLFTGLASPYTATIPTLLGIPIALALHSWTNSMQSGWVVYLGVLSVLWATAVPICGGAARILGRDDPREVVYDEITTLPLVYLGLAELTVQNVAAGFCLHRIFDIVKPLGIRSLQSLPGGWGIFADDLAAAACALGVMHLLY